MSMCLHSMSTFKKVSSADCSWGLQQPLQLQHIRLSFLPGGFNSLSSCSDGDVFDLDVFDVDVFDVDVFNEDVVDVDVFDVDVLDNHRNVIALSGVSAACTSQPSHHSIHSYLRFVHGAFR